MCLAVPGRIIEVAHSDEGPAGGRVAVVDFNGTRVKASLAMTPEAGQGDWVLVHAGFALTVLDEDEAAETWETLKMALAAGDNDPAAPTSGGVELGRCEGL